MKKYFIFLFVVLALALSCVSAFAFNSETDTVFTCDSDPADFNGKTFENLYVLLNGCTNFDSTVIPGEDAFVTLRDIKVTGRLFYGDDTYDRATNTYRDASIGENLTYIDHYLNIAGNSSINSLQIENIDPHTTNLGIDKGTLVGTMYVAPTNSPSRGKIIIRGNIDPLIDEATDYYHDAKVASYPNFTDIDTYDFEAVELLRKNMDRFIEVSALSRIYGADDNAKLYNALRVMWKQKMISDEEYNTYSRGNVLDMFVYDSYNIDIPETAVYLCNLNILNLGIDKFGGAGSKIAYGSFIPTIKSRGYTTIGSMISLVPFSTDVDTVGSYTVNSQNSEKSVLPLYIDLLTLGAEGKTLTYNMSTTSISMMNYIGNDIAGSKLDLNMGNVGDEYNSPQIGIANIIGGYFDWSCEQVYTKIDSIKKINFYEGTDLYKIIDWYTVTDVENTLYPWFTTSEEDIFTFVSDNTPNRNDLYQKRSDLFLEAMPADEYYNVLPKTTFGYFAIVKCLDDYLKTGDVNKDGISAVGFATANVSFGEVNVSKNLGSAADWINPSCHLYQNGVENSFTYSTF